LSPLSRALLVDAMARVIVGPPLDASAPRPVLVLVVRPGPKPSATHEPSLSNEATADGAKEPPPVQSLPLPTISGLSILNSSPQGESTFSPTSLFDAVTFVRCTSMH
jgi:hypothetical protein